MRRGIQDTSVWSKQANTHVEQQRNGLNLLKKLSNFTDIQTRKQNADEVLQIGGGSHFFRTYDTSFRGPEHGFSSRFVNR